MNEPLVSILMPAHHSEAFIARSIRSVIAQTYTNWELLVIADDGKDYAPVLKIQRITDPRIRLVSSGGISTGPSHARNAGLDAARGDIIATLDSDDIFHPVRLEVLVPAAMEHGYAFSTIEMRRDLGHGMVQSVFLPNYTLHANALHVDDHLPINFFSTGGVYDRLRVPLRWRENLPVNEDAVFAMQAYDYVDTTYCAPIPVYSYLRRNDSYSMNDEFFAQAVRVKKSLLDLVTSADSPFTKHATRQNFAAFLRVSLDVEKELAKKRRSDVDFVTLLQKRWQPGAK